MTGWPCTAASRSPVPCVPRRCSASATRTTRRTTARAARPRAVCSPTAGCLGYCARIGRGRAVSSQGHGEKRYRLGQCQGFDRYGESLRVYEIKELSPERYAEELVGEIKPDFRRGLSGTHHLSTDGTTTVVDHASAAFGF